MNSLEELDLVRQRFKKAKRENEERMREVERDLEIALRNAQNEIKNHRLSRREVERLLEYKSQGYTYMIEPPIPFDEAGFIFYQDLKKWASKHKPSRLKRLKRNYNQTLG